MVDAEGATLGRLAAKIAVILRGKNKPVIYTPHGHGRFIVCGEWEKVKTYRKKIGSEKLCELQRISWGLAGCKRREPLLSKKPEALYACGARDGFQKYPWKTYVKEMKVYGAKNILTRPDAKSIRIKEIEGA